MSPSQHPQDVPFDQMVVLDDDPRLTDARDPKPHGHADQADAVHVHPYADAVHAHAENAPAVHTHGLATSGGIGYGAGAGGAVTQATNKTTGVTLHTLCGRITLANSALAAGAEALFTVTDSQVAATDVVVVCHASGGTAGAYLVGIAAVAAGSFRVVVSNLSAGSLSEAIVLQFAIVKGAVN